MYIFILFWFEFFFCSILITHQNAIFRDHFVLTLVQQITTYEIDFVDLSPYLKLKNSLWYKTWNKIASLDDKTIKLVMKGIFNNNNYSLTSKNYEYLKYKGKEIYDIIFNHQNPHNCSNPNLRFLRFPGHVSGLGSTIHVAAHSLSYSISHGAILYLSPQIKYSFIEGDFCKNSIGMECYLEPLTKCSLKDIKQRESARYKGYPGTPYNHGYPTFLPKFLEGGPVPKSQYRFYWEAYSSLYLMRFNQKTMNWINFFRKNALVNPRECYDISIHVRHGDKFKEMTLIADTNYLSAIEIIKKILGREPTIFLSTEDHRTISFFINLSDKYKISHYKYPRGNFDFRQLESRGAEMSLISWANFYESVNCAFNIGTWKSNWNRLIFEVQRGKRGVFDGNKCINNEIHYLPYFEVGELECNNIVSCHNKALW